MTSQVDMGRTPLLRAAEDEMSFSDWPANVPTFPRPKHLSHTPISRSPRPLGDCDCNPMSYFLPQAAVFGKLFDYIYNQIVDVGSGYFVMLSGLSPHLLISWVTSLVEEISNSKENLIIFHLFDISPLLHLLNAICWGHFNCSFSISLGKSA